MRRALGREISACFVVLTSLAWAPLVRAQDAAATPRYLVVPLGGDAPEAMAAEACDAVRATLAAEGFGVVDGADVAAQVPPARLAEARRLEDVRPIAADLGASAIATVAVWTSDGAASSVTVSIAPGTRSFSATESIAPEHPLAEASRDAVRAALVRQRNALLVSGASTGAVEESSPATPSAPSSASASSAPHVEPTLFGIVGPGLLAAVGAAGIGASVYSMLDATCSVRGPLTGRCLVGENPNYGLGITFLIGGVVALGGAIAWWILGAGDPPPDPRIDVVFLDGGAVVRTRGTF
jgi:hypothetical protein